MQPKIENNHSDAEYWIGDPEIEKYPPPMDVTLAKVFAEVFNRAMQDARVYIFGKDVVFSPCEGDGPMYLHASLDELLSDAEDGIDDAEHFEELVDLLERHVARLREAAKRDREEQVRLKAKRESR